MEVRHVGENEKGWYLMICVSCQKVKTVIEEVTVKLPLYGHIFEIDHVPARICPHCGKQFIEDAISRQLILRAQDLESVGKIQGSLHHERSLNLEIDS